jgi:hypothetical protein
MESFMVTPFCFRIRRTSHADAGTRALRYASVVLAGSPTLIVLDVGKRRVALDDVVDGEEILSSTRSRDALLFEWAIDLEDLDPPEEAAEMIVQHLGDILRLHRDARGILVGKSSDLPEQSAARTYASIVAKLASTGRWIPNISHEEGATGAAVERSEIPLPDVPRSKRIELYVLSPARAMRELGLTEPPLRVVVSDRHTERTPTAICAFYKPLLVERGFTTKRRVWSDGSTEQIVGHTSSHHVIVHAERSDDERTFVRVAWITKR